MILQFLDKNGKIADSDNFANDNNLARDQLDAVLKSLSSEEYISLEVIERRLIELTDEGKGYVKNGSPEFQFVSAMKVGELVELPEMEKRVGAQISKIGSGKAMKQKWIKKEGKGFIRTAEKIEDVDQ